MRLSTARVVVISTNLGAGKNCLWEAAREHVGSLTLVGARRSDREGTSSNTTIGLREIDLGKGLIWRHLVGVRQAIRRMRPHLLHVSGELWGVTVQELCGMDCPVVVHGAENVWEHGRVVERMLRHRLIDRSLARISGYVSWNAAGRDHVAAYGLRFPTLVLPAIIPSEPFHSSRWQPVRPSPGAPFEILLVGRVDAQKGFDTVVDAVGMMPEIHDVIVTICGASTTGPDLGRRAQRLGVRVQALGSLAPAELAKRMSHADCLVQPSRTTPGLVEQFGRAVAEAMTVGLPCLVSSSGELPNVVGHDQSVIFTEGDARSLASQLSRMIHDRSLLAELSRRQRVIARSYSPQQASARLAEFWEDVLAWER